MQFGQVSVETVENKVHGHHCETKGSLMWSLLTCDKRYLIAL